MNKNKKQILNERWKMAEEVTEKKVYRKLKYREIQMIYFRIRPIRENFHPCPECQAKLKELLSKGSWILGNKDYDPAIELNTISWDIDDASWTEIETHPATPEEIKRIGIEGWERLGKV